MSKSSVINHQLSILRGFTLLESLAALAVASIALLALLQLQLVSIRAADKAEMMTQALFLAQAKMAEALSSGYPQVGVSSDIVEAQGDQLTWRVEVADASLPLSCQSPDGHDRARKLSVDVTWQKGPGEKHIGLTTYVAENTIREG
ncbi:MAG: prepilin-type N-terminal cleavage/methylation domain-containing protein [Planctomycetes bacterium]|nr:prepilin-type N-terminal cleavage/methylation domain-containing protein [Planctomycetota bacterium]